MKIGCHDIQHVIGQIKRASPPVTKEMHKLINNLAILLEKNTDHLDSTQEAVLTTHLERLNECFLDLCFLRREIVVQHGAEYAATVAAAVAALQENREAAAADIAGDDRHVEWNLEADCGDTAHLVPEIFSKLRKAKAVIEDALDGSIQTGADLDVDSCLEAYLNGL